MSQFINKYFHAAYVVALFCAMATLLSSCVSFGNANPTWKSIICYNSSDKSICVTSLRGIRAFQEGIGPQDIVAGNMKPTLYKTFHSRDNLNIDYPITICWVDGLLKSMSTEWPKCDSDVHQQDIRSFQNLPLGITVIKDEASLLLVFNGTAWKGYYALGKSSLSEDEINKIIGQ